MPFRAYLLTSLTSLDDTYLAAAPGIGLVPGLTRLLGGKVVLRPATGCRVAAVVTWGRKVGYPRGLRLARDLSVPLLRLEDGFIRSVEGGGAQPALSLSVDDVGIYYDATEPSRLEQCVARPNKTSSCLERAERLRNLWCLARLSKYNHAREMELNLDRPFVLAVDQTRGDASIAFGQADAGSFVRMLEAALDEHPASSVVLKVHPDVMAGRKRAHFEQMSPGQAARVHLLASDAHPPSLLEAAHAVYVVTSQMGFEALLWGRPVRTFGMPFYAGWGLTKDELPPPSRRITPHKVSLEDLVHAALVEYPRYLDPETLERCEPERLMTWMGLQRRMRERYPPQVQALGFSKWKRPIARAFFSGSDLAFLDRPEAVSKDRPLAVWGRVRPEVQPGATAASEVLRVEDGFLRSVGLGADWVRPLSWVIDRTGMYYDATTVSDLERLLAETAFDADLRQRASVLRERLVAAGVTKYNVGQGGWQRPQAAANVVLVLGQVESDASIALGAVGVRTNADLVAAVRAMRPEAHLVYKPHPDVVAGQRKRGAGEQTAQAKADEVVIDIPVYRMLEAVDEVHVITSLGGFEALLRGKPVVCHGHPFYAGWGLTQDVHPLPRRTRRLALDELVAGALILYPTYVSRVSNAFTTPERALYELEHWHELEREAKAERRRTWRLRLLRWLKRQRDRLRGPR